MITQSLSTPSKSLKRTYIGIFSKFLILLGTNENSFDTIGQKQRGI